MHPNVNITHLYQIKIQIQSLMQAWMFVFVKEQCYFQQYLYPAQIHNNTQASMHGLKLISLKGHSCKTGNVRYGGTSKTQN